MLDRHKLTKMCYFINDISWSNKKFETRRSKNIFEPLFFSLFAVVFAEHELMEVLVDWKFETQNQRDVNLFE